MAQLTVQIAYPYMRQKIGTSKDVPGAVILAGLAGVYLWSSGAKNRCAFSSRFSGSIMHSMPVSDLAR